jgi:hypothetical protein
MKTVNFSLTQDHINSGKPGIPDKCPVALCIKEKFQEYDVMIGLDASNEANCFINLTSISLPYIVQRFVDNFDARKPVRPFNFPVKIPDSLLDN